MSEATEKYLTEFLQQFQEDYLPRLSELHTKMVEAGVPENILTDYSWLVRTMKWNFEYTADAVQNPEPVGNLDEQMDARLAKSDKGFRLILGAEGSVTVLPPHGHEKQTMTDEQIREAVKYMVDGSEVQIVGGIG